MRALIICTKPDSVNDRWSTGSYQTALNVLMALNSQLHNWPLGAPVWSVNSLTRYALDIIEKNKQI